MTEEIKNTQESEAEPNFEALLEESFKNYNTDGRVTGVVVGITPTEVRVDVGRKQTGIVPLAELSNDPTAKPEDIVKVGGEINLIIMKTSQRPTGAVWVKGIIKGTYKSKTELDTDKASNIAIATSAEATEFAPVELKSNSVYREKLNVVDNAANKGKEVKLYGKITDYFSTTGVKDLESAVLDGETISGINDLKVNSKFNGAIYNLAGQRVQTMSRGLYIKDGKKFIVK